MGLEAIHTRRYFLGITLFLALLFSVLSPQGSADGAFVVRFLQWLLQVGVPLALLIGTHLLLSRWTAFDRLGPWLKLTVSGVIGAVAFSPLALALDFAFGIEDLSALQDPALMGAMLADELSGVLPPVVLVWLGLNAPRVLGLDFSRATQAAAMEGEGGADGAALAVDEPAEDGFLARLPASIGRDIVYLMAELHYVRVVTTRGRSLVLYNLRDAIAELPDGAGMQTHRSYWVAFAHVVRRVDRDGRILCLMDDGTEVPVSRRETARVRAELARRVAWPGRKTGPAGTGNR